METLMQNPNPSTIKIVYYTHPLCRTAWEMQDNWRRFIDTYGHQVNFQFCIAGDTGGGRNTEQALAPYSACLAIKAAGLQSPVAADLYLGRLRQAAIAEQQDISRIGILVDIAREVNKVHRSYFDFQRFGKDFDAKAARLALQADLQKILRNRIDTFPTITMTTGGRGIKITGFCTAQQLAQAMHKLLSTNPLTQVEP